MHRVTDMQLSLLEQLHKDTCEIIGVNRGDLYLVGGCIVSIIQGEDYKDIDVVLHEDVNVDTLDVNFVEQPNCFDFVEAGYDKIQILKHRRLDQYNTINKIVEKFDFRHCCIAYGSEGLITAYVNTIGFILKKRLIVANPISPLASVRRAYKFCQRGYEFLPKEQNELLMYLKYEDLDKVQDSDFINADLETSR